MFLENINNKFILLAIINTHTNYFWYTFRSCYSFSCLMICQLSLNSNLTHPLKLLNKEETRNIPNN